MDEIVNSFERKVHLLNLGIQKEKNIKKFHIYLKIKNYFKEKTGLKKLTNLRHKFLFLL